MKAMPRVSPQRSPLSIRLLSLRVSVRSGTRALNTCGCLHTSVIQCFGVSNCRDTRI